MKVFKYILWILLLLLIVGLLFIGAFIYKAKNGFNFYETDMHNLVAADYSGESVLILSKTNGFRHGEAIDASKGIFENLASSNKWKIYMTEDAGVFNENELNLFDVVVFNNCTGKVLNTDQRALFKNYILNGGGFLGIHGAGDDSHQWDWYEDTLIGARFSHHPIEFQIQEAELNKEIHADSSHHFNLKLPPSFKMADEWYVFYESPRISGADVLYTLDEAELSWDGSLGPFFKEKNFGMGADHPIVWYKHIGQGRSIYSAIGHNKASWQDPNHQSILEEAIKFAGGFDD